MSRHELRGFFSPVFVVGCIILALAAIGLEPALGKLIRDFSKEPIATRKPLDEIDTSRFGSLARVVDNPIFETELSEFLGAEDAVRICFEEPGNTVPELQTLLFVTYYSDPRDTIPHTPEVCYRQGGATVRRILLEPVDLPALGPDARITAQLLDLEQGGWEQVLLYVFYSNGKFYNDRLKVRLAMGMPGDRYVYFSKIEVLSAVPPETDFQDAVDRCKRLMQEALPVLVADHFPTRDDVRRRENDVAVSGDAPSAPG